MMIKTRSHWSHREPRRASKLLLRVMLVLIALCLLMQLTGCGNTRTVYVTVPPVSLPADLTSSTPIPDIPARMTWADSVVLNAELIGLLGQCNRDKQGIRDIETKRNNSTTKE